MSQEVPTCPRRCSHVPGGAHMSQEVLTCPRRCSHVHTLSFRQVSAERFLRCL
ncbi:hypothetical protein Hamer_G005040, partial [Homarus americanus]